MRHDHVTQECVSTTGVPGTLHPTGQKYPENVNESVGIACGMFISALHQMGLASLTHTPNPMGFLTEICQRPATERPYVLMPVGYPAADCEVPALERKPLEDALVVFD